MTDTEMSTNINDLNSIQELSSNIQEELDNGNGNTLDYSQLENLKKIQLDQLEQLKQLKNIEQIKNNENLINEEIKKKEVDKNRLDLFKNTFELFFESILIFVIYLLIAHPKSQRIIGRIIPKFTGNNLINIIIQGSILFIIIVLIKLIRFFL
tara:strand:+ start:242 stop:700 length:459 start_codon:yes stop_codon:yes gene_type:complete